VQPLAKQLSGLRVTENMVKDVIRDYNEDPTTWSEPDLMTLSSALRKKAKPMIIAANKADVPGAKENLERLKKANGIIAIPPAPKIIKKIRGLNFSNIFFIIFLPHYKNVLIENSSTI